MYKKGQILLIAPGEIIPVDAKCLDDESLVYDTLITGSGIPRQIRKGDKLLAGMRLAEDAEALEIKALAPATKSYLSRLDNSIVMASFDKAPIGKYVARGTRGAGESKPQRRGLCKEIVKALERAVHRDDKD